MGGDDMKHFMFETEQERRCTAWKSLLDEAVEYMKTHEDVDDIDDAIEAIIWHVPHPEKRK